MSPAAHIPTHGRHGRERISEETPDGKEKTSISPEKAIAILQSIFAVQTTLPISAKSIEIIMAKTEEQQALLRHFEIKF